MMSNEDTRTLVKQFEKRIATLNNENKKLLTQLDKASLLHEVSVSMASALDFDTIVTKAVGFFKYLGATSGEIHLLADTGEVYFKSTYPERNDINDTERQKLVRRVLQDGLDGWVLQTGQLALVLDTLTDDRWLSVEYSDQTVSVRSAICAPIKIENGHLKGAISFVHPSPHHFDQQDLNLLGTLTTYVTNALENAYQVTDIKTSLNEANLMLDMSRHLSGTSTTRDIHKALLQSIVALGAEHYTLMMCRGLGSNNVPTHAKITSVGDVVAPGANHPLLNYRFPLENHKILFNLIQNQETLIIQSVETDERLSPPERELFRQLGIESVVINPLISRIRVIGLLLVAYKTPHIFTERELVMCRTLGSQTTLATNHIDQIERTQQALTETQTLYRAGRVLAGAGEQQQILEEALIEFVYSLGLDQGGVVMISPDRQYGKLNAYLEDGELQDVETLQFAIDETIPYQKILLSGQPFVSSDFANDTKIVEFETFNQNATIKSILQAPIITDGETIGWIAADNIREARDFSQREVDLARAMADQIAIAIQNRRLLEQSQRRAEQLRAVATVGKAVTGLTDLEDVMELTVNLIRDRFGFYHVSIFLIDQAREWAVVKASTGEVGKIMVERPHKLGVGSNSIVGFVTKNANPRIALDVGQDAVHFNNPLLPNTRSEMALPLVSRGAAIGALDVQSVEPNAFSDEDIETLQVMADQITTAIDTARLFGETQQRLHEQATLYSIGTKIGGTLNLQETTDILVQETAHMINAAKCSLILVEDNGYVQVISDFVQPDTSFSTNQGQVYRIKDFTSLSAVLKSKKEVIINVDDKGAHDWELDYLKKHHGTSMVYVPILLHNEAIGTIAVYNDQPNRYFTENEINVLDSVALLAANAIDNARLFAAAQESQAFMKSIIDQIPDPIFIKDREHNWVVANTSFTEGILGQPEENIIGKNDYDFLPQKEASWYWDRENKVFETGQPLETEETIADHTGTERVLYTRQVPLTLSSDEEKPEYLIGIVQDITQRKQREFEREQLIEETHVTLERTQTLYRVSNILAASKDQQETFENVLGEFLALLRLQQGSIMLYNQAANSNVAQARYINGQPVTPKLILPIDKDLIFQHLRQHSRPLVIDNPAEHALTKSTINTRGQHDVTAMLFIPLLIRSKLVGSLVVDATQPGHKFTATDKEIGIAIADQLTIWLENHQLLQEAQHRSESLQTAADVSQAASSILNIEELIKTSVNLIRDQFDFYYVGLFLVEDNWAVLKAGTGEAGKIQLSKNHRLAVGGESMIGWSIANRTARIALDVGEEAVRFRNPVLPDTHSEMALPLVSRDKVLGALTVQSTQRLAFSNEDITLLQTMTDQLANAITNADLFTQTQTALAEAEALYKVTQAMSSARDEDMIYQLTIDSIARAGMDSAAIYTYVPLESSNDEEHLIEQKIAWAIDGKLNFPSGTRFSITDFVLVSAIPYEGYNLIENVPDNPTLSRPLQTLLQKLQITSLIVLPLSTHQKRIGFLVASYKQPGKTFSENQIRYLTTIAQQMVIALENLRLLDASQRRARREQIIREISGKIRNATDVNDILKTTVTEISKLAGSSHGQITLTPSSVTPVGSGSGNGHQQIPDGDKG